MESPWRQTCLLLALLALPVVYAVFCVGMSRRRERLIISYLAYYVLLGCVAGWFLVAGLWPSGVSTVFRLALMIGAPLICLGMAVILQIGPRRTAFDTGAMVGCYAYPALVAVMVLLHGGTFRW